MQAYESIWTWLDNAAGMAVPAGSGPAHLLGRWSTPTRVLGEGPLWAGNGREQAGSDRAAIAWRSASAGVLINEGRRLSSCLVGPDPSLLSRPLNNLGGPRQPAAAAVLGR